MAISIKLLNIFSYFLPREFIEKLCKFIEIFRNSLSVNVTTRFDIIHARAPSGVSAIAGKCGFPHGGIDDIR